MSEEEAVVLTSAERDLYEREASIYAIVRTLEVIERAWNMDKLEDAEYTSICRKICSQYHTLVESFREFVGLDRFVLANKLTSNCSLAVSRLKLGIPGTEASNVGPAEKTVYAVIANTTQSFVTAKDILELGYKDVDQLQPYIQEVVSLLSRVPGLPVSFRGHSLMKSWLMRLNQMNAHDSLVEEDTRQLSYDLDCAFRDFKEFIS
jgi:ESCRT-I complex subunit VPS28